MGNWWFYLMSAISCAFPDFLSLYLLFSLTPFCFSQGLSPIFPSICLLYPFYCSTFASRYFSLPHLGASHSKSLEYHPIKIIRCSKNHEDDQFHFFQNSFIFCFCFGAKVPTEIPEISKTRVVLLLKRQFFVMENHSIFEKRQKYQTMNYERAYLKSI